MPYYAKTFIFYALICKDIYFWWIKIICTIGLFGSGVKILLMLKNLNSIYDALYNLSRYSCWLSPLCIIWMFVCFSDLYLYIFYNWYYMNYHPLYISRFDGFWWLCKGINIIFSQRRPKEQRSLCLQYKDWHINQ